MICADFVSLDTVRPFGPGHTSFLSFSHVHRCKTGPNLSFLQTNLGAGWPGGVPRAKYRSFAIKSALNRFLLTSEASHRIRISPRRLRTTPGHTPPLWRRPRRGCQSSWTPAGPSPSPRCGMPSRRGVRREPPGGFSYSATGRSRGGFRSFKRRRAVMIGHDVR